MIDKNVYELTRFEKDNISRIVVRGLTYKCPHCGGRLYPQNKGVDKCPFCGNLIMVEYL